MSNDRSGWFGTEIESGIAAARGLRDDYSAWRYSVGTNTILLGTISVGAGVFAVGATAPAGVLLIAAMGGAAGLAGIGAGIAELAYAANHEIGTLKQIDSQVDAALGIAKGPLTLGLTVAGMVAGDGGLTSIGKNTGIAAQAALGLLSAAEDFTRPESGWKVAVGVLDAALDFKSVDWTMRDLDGARDRDAELSAQRAREDALSKAAAMAAAKAEGDLKLQERREDANAEAIRQAMAAELDRLRLQKMAEDEARRREEGRRKAEEDKRAQEEAWQKHLEEIKRERDEALAAAKKAEEYAKQKAEGERAAAAAAAAAAIVAQNNAAAQLRNQNAAMNTRRIRSSGGGGSGGYEAPDGGADDGPSTLP